MGRKERGVLTPFTFQVLRRNYTFKQIADMMGYTSSGLSRWCSRNNVITKRVTDWEISEEIKYKTPKEIAYEYNVKLDVVYSRLKKLGISARRIRGIK